MHSRSDYVHIPTTLKRAEEIWEEMPCDDIKVRELFLDLLSTGAVSENVIRRSYTPQQVDTLLWCISKKWITNNCLRVTHSSDGLAIGSYGNPFSHY